MDCRSCGKQCSEKIVEERVKYYCNSCSYITYVPRKVTSGYCTIVDEIADGVAKDGFHDAIAVILLNTGFGPGTAFYSNIEKWCDLHDFEFETISDRDARGKSQEIIRFTNKSR